MMGVSLGLIYTYFLSLFVGGVVKTYLQQKWRLPYPISWNLKIVHLMVCRYYLVTDRLTETLVSWRNGILTKAVLLNCNVKNLTRNEVKPCSNLRGPSTYLSTKYLDFGFLKPSLIILQVPDTEGRAGMVAVPDPDHTLDLKKLFIGVMDKLPGYARPFFVRCVPFLDLTGSNHTTRPH